MSELKGVRIHVDGVVQGVGFRPFVYGLAIQLEVNGWVRNTSAGVDIELDGEVDTLNEFLRRLREEKPPLAQIDRINVDRIKAQGFNNFAIIESEAVADAFQPISADVCTCNDCLVEMNDPNDRRYRYPFINCTNCGPRFTIIKDIPYDRPKTVMAEFELCEECAVEYNNPLDRRFHAQPVACPKCGPAVWMESNGGELLAREDDAILQVQRWLKQGKIVAIKGLGGFHLACDACNETAVSELRRRKLRVDKPFAVMLPNLEVVRKYCLVDEKGEELLSSQARPILLLEKKSEIRLASQVAPGQRTLGVMLPYTPLHELLFEKADFEALVMTSGNLSEEPIVTENDEARQHLLLLADGFLMHNREIHIRCDDSVGRVFEGEVMPIRRSRGYAPFPVHLTFTPPSILACGGELKNAFCLTRGNYAFMSHHIGDLENLETLESFETGIAHLERLFRVKVEAIAHDLHPNYLATRYGMERALRENLPAFGIQHHHAHIAASMVENRLSPDEPVIGAAFDGTGYGLDGKIWGGEILLVRGSEFERCLHLYESPLVGGDLAVREPWRLALTWLAEAGLVWEDDLPSVKFMRQVKNLESVFTQQMKQKINSPLTTSMGRLFDAISALAGVRQGVNYEAQAAIELEALADPAERGTYAFDILDELIDPRPVIKSVIQDLRKGVGAGVISMRFHNSVAEMLVQACKRLKRQSGVKRVVLSGGVWQNITLLKLSIEKLRVDGFEVYHHKIVPTNDGGLSLGQMAVAAWQIGKTGN